MKHVTTLTQQETEKIWPPPGDVTLWVEILQALAQKKQQVDE